MLPLIGKKTPSWYRKFRCPRLGATANWSGAEETAAEARTSQNRRPSLSCALPTLIRRGEIIDRLEGK
jgi:hypothetical protein